MTNQQKRKQRTEAIYGTTAGVLNELCVTVNQITGEISFGGEMTNVYSEMSYERPKGPKVISRVPQPQKDITFSPQDALKKNFEYRCAVDTNTRTIQGKQVSVTGVVNFQPITIPGPNGLNTFWKFDVPFCIEIIGVKVPAENFGWLAAWEQLLLRNFIKQATKVGMVVDSDLGNLKSYNERTKPLFGNVMLPANTVLAYASSDVGKDNVLNKTLSVADFVSSQSLQAIEKGLVPFNMKAGQSEWFDAMRIIYPNVIETAPTELR